MPASEPRMLMASTGSIRTFWFGDFRELRERLDVFVGNKIVQCRDVALGNGF